MVEQVGSQLPAHDIHGELHLTSVLRNFQRDDAINLQHFFKNTFSISSSRSISFLNDI